MREFGWTWEEYENTPVEVIDLILWKNEIDQKLSKLKNGNSK